jgi:hypothetical protein
LLLHLLLLSLQITVSHCTYNNCIIYIYTHYYFTVDNMTSCTLGMLSCDIFYAGSKIVIYAWLIERIHLVTAVKTPRLKTGQYKFHLILLLPSVIISALMVLPY